MNKKYYLVNYTYIPHRGESLCPNRAKVFEFDYLKTPLECYNEAKESLNKDGKSGDEWDNFSCVITDFKTIN